MKASAKAPAPQIPMLSDTRGPLSAVCRGGRHETSCLAVPKLAALLDCGIGEPPNWGIPGMLVVADGVVVSGVVCDQKEVAGDLRSVRVGRMESVAVEEHDVARFGFECYGGGFS